MVGAAVVVVAFVVPEPGARLAPADLDRHCLLQMARFKRPKRYILVDELPKNNYGKVLKTELRWLLHEAILPVIDAFAAPLRDAGIETTIRHNRGQEIGAACGQLTRLLLTSSTHAQPCRTPTT